LNPRSGKPDPKQGAVPARPPLISFHLVLLLVLSAIVAWFAAPDLLAGGRDLGRVLAGGWARPTTGVFGALIVHQAGAAVLFAGMAVAFYATGAGLLPWAGRIKAEGLIVPAAYLLGCGVISLLLLGQALVRLWFPSLLVLGVAIPAVVALSRRPGRLPAWPSRQTVLLGALPFVLVTPWLLIPELQPDAWEYYLAGPDRWIRMHGFSVRGATPPLHYPFIAEMLYSLPILFGREQVVKWLNAAALVCGTAGAAAVLEIPAGSALLVTLTSATSVYALTCGKNEGFSTGFILLAFACGLDAVRRRAGSGRALSAVFGGLAFSTKYLAGVNVTWVPLVLWWESRDRRLRPWVGWGLAAAAIALPWLVKSYLLTGDPAYPVLSGFWPALIDGWDERNGRVWQLCTMKAMPPLGVLARVGRSLLGEHPLLVLSLPFLIWRPGLPRRAGGAALAIYVIWCAAFWNPQTARYAFSSLGVVLVLTAGCWDGWRREGALGRAVATSMLGLGALTSLTRLSLYPNPFPYALGCESRAHYLNRSLTSFSEMQEAVRASAAGRVLLLVGEVREYGMPHPCLLAQAHASGETPLLWRLVDESRTSRELEAKFRQLGADRILYNFVSVELVQQAFTPFPWTDRMLGLYEAFCRSHLRLVRQSTVCDNVAGGFCLYEVDPRRKIGTPASGYFLPGAEAHYHDPLRLRRTGHPAEAIAMLADLVRRHPAVGAFRSELGYTYALEHDYANAYRCLAPSIALGMRDMFNVTSFGLAALQLEKLKEARAALEEALDHYPENRGTNRVTLGTVRFLMASGAAGHHRAAEAEEDLAAAERLLDFDPANQTEDVVAQRVSTLAWISGLRGDLARSAGRYPQAVAFYRAACAIGPSQPQAAGWNRAIAELGGR